MAGRIPPEFPLERGMLTCLSCHDVAQSCKATPETSKMNHHLLRGGPVPGPWDVLLPLSCADGL